MFERRERSEKQEDFWIPWPAPRMLIQALLRDWRRERDAELLPSNASALLEIIKELREAATRLGRRSGAWRKSARG
jgi:hypothetical protein